MPSVLDDRIEELETAILVQPTEEQLGEIVTVKCQLTPIREVAGRAGSPARNRQC